MPTSYRHGLKPLLMEGIPEFKYGVLLEDKSKDPPELRYITDLDHIPEEYCNMSADTSQVLLRQDGWTSLKAIREFHRTICDSRGVTYDVFHEHCMNADVSVDGVRESEKGRRTLTIVSVRFGHGLYVWKVYNPLVGNAAAKPDVETVLGYVRHEILVYPSEYEHFTELQARSRRVRGGRECAPQDGGL